MKVRLFTLAVVLCMMISMFGTIQPAQAKSYQVSFISSIVYMNVGNDEAIIYFDFYAEGSSTPVSYGPLTLPMNGAGSLYAGTVFPSTTFKGSVTVSSSQPLATTVVQTPPTGNAVKVRMVSNGFSVASGSTTVQSVRRTSAQVSIFSVQNADSVGADITVNFMVPGNPVPVAVDNLDNVPPGAAKYYDLGGTITTSTGSIPTTFDGSVVISAVQNNTTTAGAVVATSSEYDIASSGYKAYSFNAVSNGATTVWMPSAFCNYNQGAAGIGPINSYYAIANSSDAGIKITVEYYDIDGTHLYDDISDEIGPGEKFVSNGCAQPIPNSNTPYSGSAKVIASWFSTPGTGTPAVVTVGKVAGKAYSSAFEGVGDPGNNKVALPYVRYATGPKWNDGSRQRVFLAIQNTGSTTWGVGEASVTFYNDQGQQVGSPVTNTTEIAPGQKFNAHPGTVDENFGYWATSVGGGAIVQAPAGGSLAVLARTATWDQYMGAQWVEDYMGIPIN